VATEEPHFRVHRRRSVRLRAVVSHPRAGWKLEADVLNLGLGGACVTLLEPLLAGERVRVSFLAPTLWDPLEMPARVAWTRSSSAEAGTRVGLAFEPPDPGAVYALFELVAALAF